MKGILGFPGGRSGTGDPHALRGVAIARCPVSAQVDGVRRVDTPPVIPVRGVRLQLVADAGNREAVAVEERDVLLDGGDREGITVVGGRQPYVVGDEGVPESTPVQLL